jgi:hypothetical protein
VAGKEFAVKKYVVRLDAEERDRLNELILRAREAEAKCDHVWIFEATTLSTASPATMRRVRCIPDGTKVPRTGHPDKLVTHGLRLARA